MQAFVTIEANEPFVICNPDPVMLAAGPDCTARGTPADLQALIGFGFTDGADSTLFASMAGLSAVSLDIAAPVNGASYQLQVIFAWR